MASTYRLARQFEDFVAELVKTGRYASASDVVRDGLRLVQERETAREDKLRNLNDALDRGLESGPAERFRTADVLIAARARKRAVEG